MYLMIAARRCNIWPWWRVWPLQSCRELLPMASPWLLSDCAGSGHPIHIGPRLSNQPDWLDPCDMAGCQGRVAHHYWAMMTNITAHSAGFYIPWTKTTKNHGVNVILTAWYNCCPVTTLRNHLDVNSSVSPSALFAYISPSSQPKNLLKHNFLNFVTCILPMSLDIAFA